MIVHWAGLYSRACSAIILRERPSIGRKKRGRHRLLSERQSRQASAGAAQWMIILLWGSGVAALTFCVMYLSAYSYYAALLFLGLDAENRVGQFGSFMGVLGVPTLHLGLSALTALWVAYRIGSAPLRNGALVGVAATVANQLIILLFYNPFLLTELAKLLVLGVGGGLLGGMGARRIVYAQEILYRVSRDIGAAQSAGEIAAAVGEHLSISGLIGVSVWRVGDSTEAPSVKIELSGRWPQQPSVLGLDAYRLPCLEDVWRQSSLLLRVRRLPASLREVWEREGVRSVLLVALVAPAEKRVGLLAVASKSRRGFSRAAVRACLTAAPQAALALENFRLLEEAREAATFRERQRMAHEIHDTLAQGFTSIVMNVEAVQGVLSGKPESLRGHLEQIGSTARESLKEARRLIWALRPEQLERTPLGEALRDLAGRCSAQSGIAAGVEITGTPQLLPSETETSLLRCAQEALNNARKHSRASRLALTLSYMKDRVILDARDDGVGFETAAVAPRSEGEDSAGGFGLKAMRERAEKVGGTLTVESAPGEGTNLTVDLPTTVPGSSDGHRESTQVAAGETP